jgi:hypothetical protein
VRGVWLVVCWVCAAVLLGAGARGGGRVLGCGAWVLGVFCRCVVLIGGIGFGGCCVCLCVDIFPVYI